MWPVGANVLVFNMVDDSAQGGTPPAASDGDAWIVNNWGGTPTDGHVAVYKDRSWNDLGYPAEGDIVVVQGGGTGTPGGSFAGQGGHMLRYNGSTWDSYGMNAHVQVIVSLRDSFYKGQIWASNGNQSWYRVDAFPISGSEDNFMSLDANGMPQDSGEDAGSFAAAVHAAEHLDTGTDALQHWVSMYLPIADALDGSTPPAAIETITSTNKIQVRKFAGAAANEDVFLSFEVPYNWSGSLYYRVIGWITEATGPASGESVGFLLSAGNIADAVSLSQALGAAAQSNYDNLYAGFVRDQYDRFITALSGAVTVANMAVGSTVMLNLARDYDYGVADAYEQDVGISGIILYYQVTTKDTPVP